MRVRAGVVLVGCALASALAGAGVGAAALGAVSGPPLATVGGAAAPDADSAAVRAAQRPTRVRPVVWIQAGHAAPREPGYRDQGGAAGEVAFTTDLAARVRVILRRAGVDARVTPGLVTPLGARGESFVSLHHDAPGGAVAFGHAITGAGENWYRGEGFGLPSPVPYPDSAPHRRATTVSPAVERRSRTLAARIDRAFRPIYTRANGAGGRYTGLQPRDGNPRMMRYYGYYRTRAAARVIVEAGAVGADERFLARRALIARAVSAGVLADLRARDLL